MDVEEKLSNLIGILNRRVNKLENQVKYLVRLLPIDDQDQFEWEFKEEKL